MSRLSQDLRWALRTLGRSPVFSSMAVATLALGIGAGTAMFSTIEAVLLRPLPYADARRLLMLEGSYVQLGMERIGASAAEFLDERRERAMASLLFGVRPWDAATFAAVPLVLTGVFLLATYLPARRAARVDPLTCLRSE